MNCCLLIPWNGKVLNAQNDVDSNGTGGLGHQGGNIERSQPRTSSHERRSSPSSRIASLVAAAAALLSFNAVAQTMFGSLSAGALIETQKFARLFMAPGMWHCGMSIAAGPGPNSFGGMFQQPAPSFDAQYDLLSALTQWVEKGVPPTQVIATKYNDDQPQHGIAMQRPICVFPEIAEYDGMSNPNLPTSFKCVVNHPSDYNNAKPAPQYAP